MEGMVLLTYLSSPYIRGIANPRTIILSSKIDLLAPALVPVTRSSKGGSVALRGLGSVASRVCQ